jgi:hypothetical protein
MCGIDFSGSSEAVDVGSVRTSSMTECMNQCALNPSCAGAGWGAMGGDTDNIYSCWMKANLTKPHNATSNTWNFAILQVSPRA